MYKINLNLFGTTSFFKNKIIRLLSLSFLIILFSCSNDKNDSAQISKSSISTIIKIKNIDEQRIVYKLLNPEEKMSLWIEKFNIVLEDSKLNNNQKALIIDLRNNLKANYFSNEQDDDKEYFKTIYVVNYLKKIEKVFSREQIEDVFYKVSINRIEIGPKKACNCNKGSLFGCGASASCNNKTCEDSNTGCGFLWAWECNGVCAWTEF